MKTADSRLPKELCLSPAAVMRIAPASRLLPCQSASCCWRWAASQLLDEFTAAHSDATALRVAFDEELGESVLQRFLKLQEEHSATVAQHQAASRELESSVRHCWALEQRCAEAVEEREEVQARCELMNSQLHEAEAHLQRMLHESELKVVARSAAEMARLERRCEEAEARAEDVQQRIAAATFGLKAELCEYRDKCSTLEVKLRELKAVEMTLLNERIADRRRSRPAYSLM